MLAPKNRGEIGELAGLLVAAEQKVLFELLVIVLDHVADDAGAPEECVERDLVLSLEPLDGLVVEIHHAAKNAVLAHQVFSSSLPAVPDAGFAGARDEPEQPSKTAPMVAEVRKERRSALIEFSTSFT